MRSGLAHLADEAPPQLLVAEQRRPLVDKVAPWLEAAACEHFV